MAITDQPVVIDFIVGEDAMVWPMVAAGTSNDEIKIARDTAPDFDYEMGEVVADPADDLLPEGGPSKTTERGPNEGVATARSVPTGEQNR
jgi:hypothetical protein